MLQAFTQDEVTWLVGNVSKPLLEAVHGIQHLISINDQNLLDGNFFSKILEVLKAWKFLFFKQFDLVIIAHPDPRYRILSWTAFKKEQRYFVRGENSFPISGMFHGIHYLQLALGKCANAEDVIWPKLSLPQIHCLHRALPTQPTIVISPGGSKDHIGKKLRMWPIECYVRLAECLRYYECQIVLVGMQQDEWISECFREMNIVNLIGETSLLELIALLKISLGVITHDGGTLHLARLAGCKLCALFGPSSPKDFTLNHTNEIVLWGGDGLNCRPCYNGKSFRPCTHQSCMKQIVPENVAKLLISKWDLKRRENSNSS